MAIQVLVNLLQLAPARWVAVAEWLAALAQDPRSCRAA